MSALAPARTRPPAGAACLPARQKFNHLLTRLRSAQTQQLTHSELETMIEAEGRELLRLLLQGHLEERAPGSAAAPVVDASGRARTHLRTESRQLETVFGTVSVTRTGYGGRGLDALHPLDAALNLPPERYSHTLRRRAAERAARASFDEAVTSLAQTTGARVPKRQAEQLAQRAAQDFDAFYETRRAATAPEAHATGSILVLSSDGKGVPMRRADLRGATRQLAAARRHKLAHRRSRGEKTGTKRMGTVAAVYTTEPFVRTAEGMLAELRPEEGVTTPRHPRPEGKRVFCERRASAAGRHPPGVRAGCAPRPRTRQTLVRAGRRQLPSTPGPARGSARLRRATDDRAGLHPRLRVRVGRGVDLLP